MPPRLSDVTRFYQLLDRLSSRVGGPRLLEDCHGRMAWPARGVYFFYEPGELRTWSGTGNRIVRIGISTRLWGRLRAHRGDERGGHKASIFRTHVGIALSNRDGIPLPSNWNVMGSRSKVAQKTGGGRERRKVPNGSALEFHINRHIGAMPFLWLNVEDSAQRDSIECNSIALLSTYTHKTADKPSSSWLGGFSDRERVRQSGLWNSDYVDEDCDPSFLDTLERRIELTHRL